VDEETMPTVRRIFRLVGEGASIRSVRDALEREGVPAPSGGRRWSRTTVRNIVLDDCYRPHTVEELEALVTPDVRARLDPERLYGISWWGRRRTSVKQVSENGPEGRRYRRMRKAVEKPREEWVAVPVPDSRIAREVVDAARSGIKDNKPTSSAGDRYWELSGGILVCAGCGRSMTPDTKRRHSDANKWHIYYRCSGRHGIEACTIRPNVRAKEAEAEVWKLISDYLKNPDRIREGLDQMIEEERRGTRGDPEREAKAWLNKLVEADRKRVRYQEMAAADLISFAELSARLEELEETRRVAEQELSAIESRKERISQLEGDKAELLESFSAMIPERVDAIKCEKRHRIYKRLRLKVAVGAGGQLEEAQGVFLDRVCTNERTC
jgi:hypothetical protein